MHCPVAAALSRQVCVSRIASTALSSRVARPVLRVMINDHVLEVGGPRDQALTEWLPSHGPRRRGGLEPVARRTSRNQPRPLPPCSRTDSPCTATGS